MHHRAVTQDSLEVSAERPAGNSCWPPHHLPTIAAEGRSDKIWHILYRYIWVKSPWRYNLIVAKLRKMGRNSNSLFKLCKKGPTNTCKYEGRAGRLNAAPFKARCRHVCSFKQTNRLNKRTCASLRACGCTWWSLKLRSWCHYAGLSIQVVNLCYLYSQGSPLPLWRQSPTIFKMKVETLSIWGSPQEETHFSPKKKNLCYV